MVLLVKFLNQKIKLKIINPSDFNKKGFKGVDSAPYGGGPGMVMRADVLAECINEGIKPFTTL